MAIMAVFPIEVTAACFTGLILLGFMIRFHMFSAASEIFKLVIASFKCTYNSVVGVHMASLEVLVCLFVIKRG